MKMADDLLKKDPLTLNVLLAAGEFFGEYRTRAGRVRMQMLDEADLYFFKQQICQRFSIDPAHLEWAITDVYLGLAHPSEAFVNARDVAQRVKGRKLTSMELASIIRTIEDQEAIMDWLE
jgi:hypothetical protein